MGCQRTACEIGAGCPRTACEMLVLDIGRDLGKRESIFWYVAVHCIF